MLAVRAELQESNYQCLMRASLLLKKRVCFHFFCKNSYFMVNLLSLNWRLRASALGILYSRVTVTDISVLICFPPFRSLQFPQPTMLY